jgi:hypothetical protein
LHTKSSVTRAIERRFPVDTLKSEQVRCLPRLLSLVFLTYTLLQRGEVYPLGSSFDIDTNWCPPFYSSQYMLHLLHCEPTFFEYYQASCHEFWYTLRATSFALLSTSVCQLSLEESSSYSNHPFYPSSLAQSPFPKHGMAPSYRTRMLPET